MFQEDRLKLDLSFDPQSLRDDLARAARSKWTAHFVRQNYEGDWSAMPLRSPAGETHPIRLIYADPMATSFVDTPLLDGCGYFREVIAAFECPVRCVRLMKLTPGSIIKEHTDHDLEFESGKVRIHIPITTNPGVEFELNGRRVTMAPGEAWYLKLADPHRVANKGDTDRVHLVLDAEVNDWVRDLFARSAKARAPVANPVEAM
jgi:quercetin dioxygenase-like cupin family protein